MRATFVRTLVDLAGDHPELLLLTADLGFMALEPFAERHPGRFFNVGVAEQNMIGLAAGLAESGFIPYAYSIATFASMRGYEFLRHAALDRRRVRLVGMGGGYEYGTAGHTHHAVEDVAIWRTQPGVTVVAPADAGQAEAAVRATVLIEGPLYLRLGKDDRVRVPGLGGRFRLGRAERVREGADLLLVAMGPAAASAAAAADDLAGDGVETEVLVVASFNPSPLEDLAEASGRHRLALSVEAHHRDGGVGSLVAEAIAEAGTGCRLVRLGIGVAPAGGAGGQAALEARAGISREAIRSAALGALARHR